MRLHGRVLSVAGSDSGGGAGIQADIKTVTCLGGYAMTAITALTVQDTCGVHAIHPTPPAVVAAQIACALADPGVDAIKTGMLVDAATIAAVQASIDPAAAGLPLIVDPVMVATSGDTLLREDGVQAMRRLMALATLVTPNLAEAAVLAAIPVVTTADMRHAAAILLAGGAGAVLIKGGHRPGPCVADLLVTAAGERLFEHERIAGFSTHGTGCTLAAAIATFLAQGAALEDAVARAIGYVAQAIRAAPGFGAGHGPLNHAITVQRFDQRARRRPDTGRLIRA